MDAIKGEKRFFAFQFWPSYDSQNVAEIKSVYIELKNLNRESHEVDTKMLLLCPERRIRGRKYWKKRQNGMHLKKEMRERAEEGVGTTEL